MAIVLLLVVGSKSIQELLVIFIWSMNGFSSTKPISNTHLPMNCQCRRKNKYILTINTYQWQILQILQRFSLWILKAECVWVCVCVCVYIGSPASHPWVFELWQGACILAFSGHRALYKTIRKPQQTGVDHPIYNNSSLHVMSPISFLDSLVGSSVIMTKQHAKKFPKSMPQTW